jgi:hypothetical protein
MDQKYSKIFNKSTTETITKFCQLNNLEDVDGFILKCFRRGFDIERYGLLSDDEPERVEQVEVIKYIEREIIKEVPVEKIVTKIEYIRDKKFEKELDELRQTLDNKTNNEENRMLQETLQKLRKELIEKNNKIEELEKINNDLKDESSKKIAVYLRGSNINQKI